MSIHTYSFEVRHGLLFVYRINGRQGRNRRIQGAYSSPLPFFLYIYIRIREKGKIMKHFYKMLWIRYLRRKIG